MKYIPSLQGSLVAILAVVLLAAVAPVAAVDLPDSPDGTVRAVAQALSEQHPEVIWQALPPTYQKDITEITHTFASRMDPTVWNAAFDLGRKTVRIMRDKKDIILSSSMLENAGDKREDIAGGWDTMVGALDSFFESDITRLETLKAIDWERYLSTTGRELMALAAERSKAAGDDSYQRELAKLTDTKIEVLSRDGDQATLRLSAPDEEPEEVQLTRVEGRWVPTEMAQDWDQNMAEAKAKLASLTDEEIQQGSMQAMMVIGMVDGMLTQLESVQTAEELEAAIEGALGPMLGAFMQPGMEGDMGDMTWEEEPAEPIDG